MYLELVKRLRDADEKSMCGECGLNLHTGATKKGVLFAQAADAIEELANKLCDWCGVCPKERRRPWDCEIMWPDAPIPEVCIEPPKEE